MKDKIKVIILGDAASGKSKLMERFLLDKYQPDRISTQAVNIFHYPAQRMQIIEYLRRSPSFR
jgi:Rab-like protein 2